MTVRLLYSFCVDIIILFLANLGWWTAIWWIIDKIGYHLRCSFLCKSVLVLLTIKKRLEYRKLIGSKKESIIQLFPSLFTQDRDNFVQLPVLKVACMLKVVQIIAVRSSSQYLKKKHHSLFAFFHSAAVVWSDAPLSISDSIWRGAENASDFNECRSHTEREEKRPRRAVALSL